MRVFALTGGIGSGKSTVARLFAQRGVPVVDADRVAREVVATGSPTLARVVGAFGPQVLGPGGALDRAALGRLVFGDPDLRDKLNAIVHPEIKLRVEQRWQSLAADGATLACYDIPLLFETHQQDRYRPVVVVTAPEAERIARIVERDGLEPSAVRERIAAQMPLSEKVAQADIVVDNDGDLEHLEQQAVSALEKVRRWST